MKKRAMSMLLVLLMVVTLLPTFAAAEDATFDYAVATDPTGGAWTINDITSYQSNGDSHDQYTLNDDHTLYYKDGNNYYPVDFVNDTEYFYKAYSGPEALKIYDTFRFDSGTWGKKTSTEYFAYYNGDMHCVYANNRSSAGRYDVTLFIYKDSRYGNTVTNKSSWTNAYSRTVLMLSGNSTTPSVTQGEWFYTYQWLGATVGTSHNYYYGNDTGTPPQLYLRGEDGSKKAIVYTDASGNVQGYLKNPDGTETRNWKMEVTTAASPKSPSYSGQLYYMRDLSQVPIVNPDIPSDPTPTPGGEETIVNPPVTNDEGFKLTKALGPNKQGSYDLTMQSYSTANTVKYGIIEKVPTDFIVVVDQSGSMDTADMATGYTQTSTKTLEECATGRYYYKDGDNYYRVYATKDYLMEYHPTETKWTQDILDDAGYDLSWFQGEDEATFTQANQYYYRTPDGVYRPVAVTAEGKVGTYYVRFKYKDANGQEVLFTRPSKPVYKNVFGNGKYSPNSLGYAAVNAAVLTAYPNVNAYTYSEFLGVTTGMYVNYPMYTRHVGYNELCYRDVNGVEHLIGPNAGDSIAEFCDANGNAVISAGSSTRMNYDGLYEATGYETRIDALKGALTAFVKAVAAESDSKDGVGTTCPVDNRIAIVGFSSLNDGWYGQYDNTEILTGENLTVSGNNGVYFEDATNSDYATALVSATDGQIGADHVNPKLTQAINAITANGGTQPEYGFQMAKSIMDNRSLTQYTLQTGDQSTKNRNVIVVFFTDGQPGDYYISNQYSEANDVVASALPLKTAGAKVFSIGVFGESDGNPLTYYDRTATSESQTKDWKFLGGWMETYRESGTYYCMRRQWRPAGAEGNLGYTATANDTIFDYMSVTSSNYPGATKFIDQAWLDGNYSGTYEAATDGVRHKDTAAPTNQFYRMAATQDTLVKAFEQSVTYASSQQQHADVVNLNTTAVFRDVINTADFDISHATYSVIWQPIHVVGTPGAADNKVEDDTSKQAEVKVNKQPVPASGIIEYSGFDYSANFVTNVKREGLKLVVKVEGLVPTTFNKEIKSNADKVVDGKDVYACGIYEYGKDTAEYSVQSPTLRVDMVEPDNGTVDLKKDIDTTSATDGTYTIIMQGFAKGNFTHEGLVKLDKDGYLLDTINLENLSLKDGLDRPTIVVKTQKGTADTNGNITWDVDENSKPVTEDITDKCTVTYNGTTGELRVYGFDYAANYIGNPKPMNAQEGTAKNQGKKLIVEIGGLVPKHAGDNQDSNTTAGVYNKNDVLVQDVASPKFSLSSDTMKTYVIDFSAPMKVATEATSATQTMTNNGSFSLIGTDVVYQLDGSPDGGNLKLEGMDQAFVHGKLANVENAKVDWCTITTIPAGSVYFDDDFAKMTEAIDVGDGSGYNVSVTASPTEENQDKGTYTFTFNGTGIDIYCTTAPDGGMIQAKIDGGKTNGQPDMNKVQSVRNYDKEVTRYNVPTISFRNLGEGEHTLELNVLGTSNYKLDGVRIYNPVSNETYEGQGTHEQYAAFINMRESLVNDNGVTAAFEDNQMDNEAVIGALFVDDSSKLTTEPRQQYDAQTHEPRVDADGNPIMGPAYASLYVAYQKNSPKHEIYLSKNQAIVFQLTEAAETAAASGNLWIGLSAPDQNKNTGTVTLKEGKTIDVTSGVDMYYPITSDMIGANRVVTITNTGDNMISVTNLKITGNVAIYNAAAAVHPKSAGESTGNSAAQVESFEDVVSMVFEPMTLQTMKIAANGGVDPDAVVTDDPGTPDDPTPDKPGWNDDAWNPANILKTLFKLLLDSLSSLFSGLGNW